LAATGTALAVAGFTAVAGLAGASFLGTGTAGVVWASVSELATSKPTTTMLASASGFRKAAFDRTFIFCLLFDVLFAGQMYLKAKQTAPTRTMNREFPVLRLKYPEFCRLTPTAAGSA
jgi:hypothetical protein